MLKTEKKIKIRNRLREMNEQKNVLLHNLNFVPEETAVLYFEKHPEKQKTRSGIYRCGFSVFPKKSGWKDAEKRYFWSKDGLKA